MSTQTVLNGALGTLFDVFQAPPEVVVISYDSNQKSLTSLPGRLFSAEFVERLSVNKTLSH